MLASASPRRLELLRSLGVEVDVLASGHPEDDPPGVAPAELAAHHAREKLGTALERFAREPHVPVLAADTVVDLDGRSLGKPADPQAAAEMLASLSGREHFVHTAFAVAAGGAALAAEACVTTRVWFFPLEQSEIAEYVASGEPFDKAGGYGIQGRAAALVERIDGDFYAVMGLPLARVVRTLRRLGFVLPSTK